MERRAECNTPPAWLSLSGLPTAAHRSPLLGAPFAAHPIAYLASLPRPRRPPCHCSKAEELLQRLLDHAAGEPASPAPATVRKAAKTPRTSRKAAGPAAEPAGPTPAAAKAALLRAAASTPLPPPRSEEKLIVVEEKWVHVEAIDADGEEQEDGRSRRRSAASTPRRPGQPGGGAPPSSVRRGRSPSATRPRATAAGLATPLFLVLLATAAVAAFAALAVPYCQHHDCAELARNLPGLAGEAAAAGWGLARARALAGADVLQEGVQQLVGASSCPGNTRVLHGAAWERAACGMWHVAWSAGARRMPPCLTTCCRLA